MRFFRRHRFRLSWLASLAMLIGALAAVAAPHPVQAAGGKQVYDAVLGWMPVCAPSSLGQDGKAPQHQTKAHACCAFACAAASVTAIAPILVVESAELQPATRSLYFESDSIIHRPRRYSGSVSSRGPPLKS